MNEAAADTSPTLVRAAAPPSVCAESCDVAILLSTYNGSAFLPEQLQSFEEQRCVRWRLIWRDDGSADNTVTMVRDFADGLLPGQSEEAPDSGVNLGIFDSFMSLLGEALGDPAVAFADQDDVWLPEKLERALAYLKTVDPARPAVYCARQILVDEALRPIGQSATPRVAPGFPGLLLQNIGTGCTLVMNRAAVRAVVASRKPRRSYHDWWTCLYVSAIGGEIFFDNTPVMLYRQHGSNAVGASKSRFRRLKGALKRGGGAHNERFTMHLKALLENREQLAPEAALTVRTLADGWFGTLPRRLGLFKIPGFRRQAHIENILLAIWVIRGNLSFGRRLRRVLRNPVTIFLYTQCMNVCRETMIARDIINFRLSDTPLPEPVCLKEPGLGACYSRLAILVIFAESLDDNQARIISGLTGAGYAVALINNRPFSSYKTLPERVAFVIENHNVGRDIGAYVRGLRLIQTRCTLNPDAQVLFMNDSVIYLPGHEEIIANIAKNGADWIGVTENYHLEYYLASWCFALSIRVIESMAFRRWVTRFRPLDNRAYLISAGEIALSRTLLRAGFRPTVIFNSKFWDVLAHIADPTADRLYSIIPNYLRNMDRDGANPKGILSRANQAHLFTFAGVISGRFPFLKKDIWYRDVFDRPDIEALCDVISRTYGYAIAAECRHVILLRANGRERKGWAKLRWMLGID